MKLYVLSVFVCLYFFNAFALAQTASAYAEAASAFQQGRLEQAEHTLRAALKSDAERPDLLGLLAVVLDAKKEFEAAEPIHRHAIKLAPNSAGLWNNLGNHFLGRGNQKQAVAAFHRVLEIDPGHINANLQLARIAVSEKNGADALRHIEKLHPADQNAVPVQLLRARALHLAGQSAAAIGLIENLERADAADARLAFSIGMIFVEWRQYESAEGAFSSALERDPANVEILRNLGLAALHARHFDRAEHVFDLVLEQRPDDVDSLTSLARVYADRGDNDTALVLLAKARRLAPNRPDLLLALAKVYSGTGFISSAAEAYDAYLKLEPSDASARRERGFAYCRFGHVNTALADLNWYVAKNPADPVGHFELGLCQTLGDTSQALTQLNAALQLKPDFMPARQARGWIFERDGRWQEALPDLKLVVEREPKNPMALLLVGRIYLELGQPAEAIGYLRRAQDLAPDHTGVLKQLHRALRRLGQDEEAAAVLEKLKKAPPDRTTVKAQAQVFDYMALDPAEQGQRFRRNLMAAVAANPSDPELQVQLGALLLNDGNTEQALATFRQILTASPGPGILREGAAVLTEHKQYALGRQLLARAVIADPSADNRLDLAVATFHSAGPEASLAEIEKIPAADRNGDVYLLKAQIQDALGRFEDAVNSLNTAFQRSPRRSDLYSWAALFLIRHKRDQQALQLLDQATKILPDDPDLLLTKATVLELVRKTDESEELLKKIQLHWPEWGRVYLIRGIIEATHRNLDDALQAIQTAIALGERTSIAYYYLADLTRSAKPDDREGARRAIAEALQLDPKDAASNALAGKIALDAELPVKAVEYLNEAIRLDPNLTEAHYSLSIAYRKLGHQEQSKAELDLVRQLRQQNPVSEDHSAGIRELLFVGEDPR